MTTTAIATTEAGALATFSEADQKLIMDTVAKGCSPSEFGLLMYQAQIYGLNPLNKEIWAVKRSASDPAVIMTGRDGYIKIAQRSPDYMGLQAAVVRKGDEFAFDPANGTVEHKFGTDRGPILGAWAIAHHRLRMPVVCYVEFGEYKGTSPVWTKYPSAMIQKVAEVFALKRQFGISGLVSREEMDAGEVDTVQQAATTPADSNAPARPTRKRNTQASLEPAPRLPGSLDKDLDPEALEKRSSRVREAREKHGIDRTELPAIFQANFGHQSLKRMTQAQENLLCEEILPVLGQDKKAAEAEAAGELGVVDGEYEEIPDGALQHGA